MTYQQIFDYIRLNIDDIEKTRYVDNELTLFVLSAFRKVFNAIISNGYNPSVKDATITITGQLTDLDTDPYKILAVQDKNEYPIEIMEETKARRSKERAVFFRIGTGGVTQIGWYTDTSSSIDLVYQYIPKIISSIANFEDTNTDIPEIYHDLIVYWATVLALATDEDNAGTFAGLYQAGEISMLESLSTDAKRNKTVVQTESWF